MTISKPEKMRVIASKENWIEGIAVSQLRGTSELPGMNLAVGLPDLHPGKCGPVGAAFVSKILYPHLAGNDVGCGMGLWLSDLNRRKLKLDRFENKLRDLDAPWDGAVEAWLESFGCQINVPSSTSSDAPADRFNAALGTIGGGNHFAELQQIDSVADRSNFNALGLDEDRLVVLIHSGSRGLGKDVLLSHQRQHGYGGLETDSEDAENYMLRHDHAVIWGEANRALIAWRFLNMLGSEARRVLDLPHNFIAREMLDGGEFWVHRKGANPSTRGALVIPGSRGSLSYIVMPCGEQDLNARSVSHGAGRKWSRSDCRRRLERRFDEESLKRTDLGSRVICEDRALLYEEAPQAYKDVEIVVKDLVDAGLVRVVATLRPLITYKVRRAV